MIKKTTFLIILFCSTLLNSSPADFNYYFIKAAKIAKPSVVNIIIYKKKRISNRYSYIKVADGSGTIISKSGYIITNYHVVAKGNYYKIVNYKGKIFEAALQNNKRYFIADAKTDIALLKIYNPENIHFEPIKFADSNNLQEGEWVLAIGSPYGLKQSITGGIVSSKGRDNVGFADIEDFIQSDVSINPGNSGGPLINLYGNLVGINTAIRTSSGGYQGISFAIPSNLVKRIYYELKRYGRVRRGWIGFIAKENSSGNRNVSSYVKIFSVMRNSPASRAGLKRGDIIMKIDGKKINSLGRLIKSVGSKPISSKIYITISRKGRIYNYKLIMREKRIYKKIQEGMNSLFSLYGIEIDKNANSNDIIISYVSPRSIAYGLKKGDVIVYLNGKKVFSIEDFINKFDKFGRRISYLEVYRESHLYRINFTRTGGY